MKHVRKSVLLWYPPQILYDLVTDVERYPEFLPWCAQADVLERHEAGMTARLTLAYAGVRHAFTTRNTHDRARSVSVLLVDGPFRLLEGDWQFRSLGRPGQDEPACRIELDLRYAFSSAPLEAVLSPVFDRVANTLVDSFVQRPEDVHGKR